MNRYEFLRGLKAHYDISDRVKRKTMNDTYNRVGWKTLLISCMEEMAELTQQISKALRGFGDHIGILEEMADVYLCMDYLKRIYDISDDELNNAIAVKIMRQKKRNNLFYKGE